MWPFGKKKVVEPEIYVPKPDPKVGEFWLLSRGMDNPFLQVSDTTVAQITGVQDGFVQYKIAESTCVNTVSYFKSWYIKSKYLNANTSN